MIRRKNVHFDFYHAAVLIEKHLPRKYSGQHKQDSYANWKEDSIESVFVYLCWSHQIAS